MGSSEDKDKELERGNWSGKLDFLLSCIGYAVGLGNVWRFPYLCYRNGGGAFLIPYAIMLFISGIPLFFLELSLGQFSSQGPVTAWAVAPAFKGVGWAMILISGMVCTYYNVIIMYSVYYMFVSFVHLDDQVPWQSCNQTWADKFCRDTPYPDFDALNETLRTNKSLELKNVTCVEEKMAKWSTALSSVYELPYEWLKANTSDCDWKYQTPSEQFWNNYMLRVNEADGLENIGGISLKNIICLFLCWIFIFFCLMKGVKSSGKVVYFTATFPYIVLVILLVRGLTLPGMEKGIKFYITPKWDLLTNPKVWGDAATQIFYSLGPGFGGLLTMSSYNKFKNNCLRDAFLVSLINCGTSVFAGFAIFSLLGYLSDYNNVDVADVADSGPGLAFIAYPEGIARLPSPAIFAFLFFFMLFTLGLDSQFAMMETVISGISDVFPRYLRKHKMLFTFFCCMVGFLLGIPQVTKGGIYILTLTDWYSGSYNLMLVGLVEVVALSYVYGVNNFRQDIQMMLGRSNIYTPFFAYFFGTWCFLTPVSIAFIIIMMAVHYSPASLGDYVFPPFAEALGWLMVVAPIVCIIIGFIVEVVRKGTAAFKPEPSWGPALDEDRTGKYSPLNDVGDGQTNKGYTSQEKDYEMRPPSYNGKYRNGTENYAYAGEKM